jgi:hypothetical protein
LLRYPRFTVEVDDVVTADLEHPHASGKAAVGPIKFECHEHIRFRNVRVKRL